MIWFLDRFGLKTVIDFAHFGLESGLVFEGTTVVYEHICRLVPNEFSESRIQDFLGSRFTGRVVVGDVFLILTQSLMSYK